LRRYDEAERDDAGCLRAEMPGGAEIYTVDELDGFIQDTELDRQRAKRGEEVGLYTLLLHAVDP
jgi:hypothetical protein